MSNDFELAGTDLTILVEEWLTEVEGHADSDLLQLAESDSVKGDRYSYGMAGLMQRIGPRVWGDSGSPVELLLFAALACYQEYLGHSSGETWPGPRAHVRRAFVYVQGIGEDAAANILRGMVARRATNDEDKQRFDEMVWAGKTVAEQAAHEQVMADGDLRDLRAAKALDGSDGDPWAFMPQV